jgi:SAM-dependent methyltransferase
MQHMADGITNLFVHRSAAQRYAVARPYFHPLVIGRVAARTGTPRFDRALDVACGTGQSSRALAAVAERVDAVDVSPEMVSEAEPHERVRYHVAPAERLPFADASFDLATVGLAFHWFDQAAFLAEARRVLKPASWLAVYNSGFYGEMAEDAGFRTWARITYPARFPTPARRSFGVGGELAAAHGFSLVGEEAFTHDEAMTAEQLTAYLSTQTNVIAAVESGRTPLPEAAAWILDGVRPFFAGAARTMRFGGTIWFLGRTGGVG